MSKKPIDIYKVIIKQEISPFHGDIIVWSCILPDYKWKHLDEYLYNVLDALEDKIMEIENEKTD